MLLLQHRAASLSVAGAALGVASSFVASLARHAWIAGRATASDAASEFVTDLLFATGGTLTLSVFGYLAGRAWAQAARDAAIDALTRVGNRRAFEPRLAEEIVRARVAQMPLSLLVVDVDGMKQTNDEYGHGAGDAVLVSVAETLARACRARDFVGRWGGDEFVLLLPRTRALEAAALADRIQKALAAGDDPIRPTLSIGVAEYSGRRSVAPMTLFDAADRALYTAKARGHGHTSVAPSSEPVRSSSIRPVPSIGVHALRTSQPRVH